MLVQVTLPIINEQQQSEYYFGPQGFMILTSDAAIAQAKDNLGLLHDGDLPTHTQSWEVVAQDTELGDPYFIDKSDFTGAVYTTTPGCWTKTLVATSVNKFIECLELLQDASPQQQALFVPDSTVLDTPMVLAELELLLGKLSGAVNFWGDFFAGYQSWLNDDDDFDEELDEDFSQQFPQE